MVEVAHIFPPLVGYAKQPSLLGVIEGVEGLMKDDRCKRCIDLITCDGRVYTCILFRAVCLAYIKTFDV